jgi:AAA ATPase domain
MSPGRTCAELVSTRASSMDAEPKRAARSSCDARTWSAARARTAADSAREGIDPDGPGWWAGRMAGVAGFVGRERELSGLGAALGAGTRLVLVVGDAGVGKTRFAGEGMRRAAAGGLVSVWGRCLPLAEKLPLLPVTEALGELSWLDDGGLLEAALGMVPPYVRVEVAA